MQTAVIAAIAEINENAEHEPNNQTDRRSERKVRHQIAGDQNSEYWNQRNHGGPERTLQIGIATTDDPYARTNDHKDQQTAYVHHITQQVNRQRRSQQNNASYHRDSITPHSTKL